MNEDRDFENETEEDIDKLVTRRTALLFQAQAPATFINVLRKVWRPFAKQLRTMQQGGTPPGEMMYAVSALLGEQVYETIIRTQRDPQEAAKLATQLLHVAADLVSQRLSHHNPAPDDTKH